MKLFPPPKIFCALWSLLLTIRPYTWGGFDDGKEVHTKFYPYGAHSNKRNDREGAWVTPEEIVEQVLEASELGANMVHLHAREPDTGLPTYKKEIYAEIISGIRRKNRELILCVSTSGRHFFEFEKRSEVLELEGEVKPDFGSLTLSSLNFNKQASINTPQMIQDLARKMISNSIRPELEAFDFGMINYSKYLIKKGVTKASLLF